jgi:hypothetical protein
MLTDVSEVRAASIITLMTEAAHTSETLVYIQLRTQKYIPEDSELHTDTIFILIPAINSFLLPSVNPCNALLVTEFQDHDTKAVFVNFRETFGSYSSQYEDHSLL